MTSPQNILYNLNYVVNELREDLTGGREHDDNEQIHIYHRVKEIQICISQVNNRMQLLEDKMNLIIKLLSKE